MVPWDRLALLGFVTKHRPVTLASKSNSREATERGKAAGGQQSGVLYSSLVGGWAARLKYQSIQNDDTPLRHEDREGGRVCNWTGSLGRSREAVGWERTGRGELGAGGLQAHDVMIAPPTVQPACATDFHFVGAQMHLACLGRKWGFY